MLLERQYMSVFSFGKTLYLGARLFLISAIAEVRLLCVWVFLVPLARILLSNEWPLGQTEKSPY